MDGTARMESKMDWPPIGSQWRHVKSGGVYRVKDLCLIEATLAPAVIYEGSHGYVQGKVLWNTWCRPISEFLDGRFVRHSKDGE